jgi:hypothetical protein
MTKSTACPICNGNKFVMNAGYIQAKCSNCKGTGFIDVAPVITQEQPVEQPAKEVTPAPEIVKIVDEEAKKAKGWPKGKKRS